ncbi:MAG: translocation/assembly module TamB, partial [Sphingopyxis sp.]
MRRLDNGFLATLTGGLPVLTTGLSIGPDGVVRLTGARLASPLLNLTGGGMRRADGQLMLTGRGAHRVYGPVEFELDGNIARPRITVRLANPLPSAGLRDVTLRLLPMAAGFDYQASGGSMLGPFAADGQIVLAAGQSAVIDVQRLNVGGTVARGRLAVVRGGLAGQMLVNGGGLDGSIILSAPGGVQRIVAAMQARDARFSGPPPISVARGQLNATILLDPRGTDIDATFEATGLRRGTLSIARVAGNAHWVDGVGAVRASMAGARGRDFSFQTAVDVARDGFRVRGQGMLARQPIRLTRPAIVQRDG